jgi:hypothetical protein
MEKQVSEEERAVPPPPPPSPTYAPPPPPRAIEKPTAAYALSLIGGILILIGGIGHAFLGAICGSLVSMIPGAESAGGVIFLYMSLGLICGIIVIIGAVMINKAEPAKVKTGSVLVLVFSIISIISGGGFYIGTILGIVGGILGLVWKP